MNGLDKLMEDRKWMASKMTRLILVAALEGRAKEACFTAIGEIFYIFLFDLKSKGKTELALKLEKACVDLAEKSWNTAKPMLDDLHERLGLPRDQQGDGT